MRAYRDQLTLPVLAASLQRSTWSWLCASLCLIGLHAVTAHRVFAKEPEPVGTFRPEQRRLQVLVDNLKARLSIPQNVVVSIVPANPLMMSVEAPTDSTGEFRISIEATFLDILTDAELEAAIAHELGHVWVFTHHPYLQTEALANQIATRVVSRGSLESVYEKVWKRGGTKGDIARFLGPVAALTGDDQPSQTEH